jgi:hypothetical protein
MTAVRNVPSHYLLGAAANATNQLTLKGTFIIDAEKGR